ncbi:MAG: VOC family protein [Armatimonadetes bacterium]|nr:VOC family protein [Armatimonadota bacterium]
MSNHAIVHVEIPAQDLDAAGKFYSELFGWAIQPMPDFEYATFDAPGGPGGGFPKVDGQMYKPGDVVVYVSTDDIEATLAKAESLGARTLVPRSEVPGFGWFAMFSDPSGNRMALWTAGPNGPR